MPRFVLFTKTYWDEPPRLRHQFAELLAGAGHDVLFFEKPTSTGPARSNASVVAPNITTMQHRELIHHKLRLSPLVHRANALVTMRSIGRRLRGRPLDAEDVVICFNYEYWFLRRLFPRNQIITVINDDFICRALFGYTRPLLWALQRTCAGSNRVLTVSVPLQRQLDPFGAAELFLPWADRPYSAPAVSTLRNVLLFWGYTNRRIDFAAAGAVADRLAHERPDIRILFVGPIANGVGRAVEALRERTNVQFQSSATLDELPLDRVLAAYIPYRPFNPEIDAITLSNKALQLLARGLPLLISPLPGLPNFVEAPFVLRFDQEAPERQIDMLRETFDSLQPAIAAFVDENGPDARLRQLLEPSL
jgi:hypothetical protein